MSPIPAGFKGKSERFVTFFCRKLAAVFVAVLELNGDPVRNSDAPASSPSHHENQKQPPPPPDSRKYFMCFWFSVSLEHFL